MYQASLFPAVPLNARESAAPIITLGHPDDINTPAPTNTHDSAVPPYAECIIVGVDGGKSEKIKVAAADKLIRCPAKTINETVRWVLEQDPRYVVVMEASTDSLYGVDQADIITLAAAYPGRVRQVKNSRARSVVRDNDHLWRKARVKDPTTKKYYLPMNMDDSVAARALSLLRYNQTHPYRPSRINDSPWRDHLTSREDGYENSDVDAWMSVLPPATLAWAQADPAGLFVDYGPKKGASWKRREISWIAKIVYDNGGTIGWNKLRREMRVIGPLTELRGRLMRAYCAQKHGVKNVAHAMDGDRTPAMRREAFDYIDRFLMELFCPQK